ncbi:hypothetical protein LIA77_11303 [Sarocladium implicatum]|nr:hypothetical protein LIA77_11303 [Sarocladium implicatum]
MGTPSVPSIRKGCIQHIKETGSTRERTLAGYMPLWLSIQAAASFSNPIVTMRWGCARGPENIPSQLVGCTGQFLRRLYFRHAAHRAKGGNDYLGRPDGHSAGKDYLAFMIQSNR